MLRCRDAIEELHHEIEDERTAKTAVQKEMQEAQGMLHDMRIREKELIFEVEQLHEKTAQMQSQVQAGAQVRDLNT